MMTPEEELYWRNQPAWAVNAEMERRLAAYFESPAYRKKLHYRERRDARNARLRDNAFEKSIDQLKKAI